MGYEDGKELEHEDEEEVEMTPEEIEAEFDEIFQKDPQLQQLLGGQPDNYVLEEKYSIVQAYKKGGGIEGLKDIIDDDDEDEEGIDPQNQVQQFMDSNAIENDNANNLN